MIFLMGCSRAFGGRGPGIMSDHSVFPLCPDQYAYFTRSYEMSEIILLRSNHLFSDNK
jgi:hypothetical protein